MQEKARVFIAEDNPDFLDTLRMVLEEAGHTVTLTASTIEDALSAINNFSIRWKSKAWCTVWIRWTAVSSCYQANSSWC